MEIDEITEQRDFDKIREKLTDMLRAIYFDNALIKASVFKRIRLFKDSREYAKDDARPRRFSLMCKVMNFP